MEQQKQEQLIMKTSDIINESIDIVFNDKTDIIIIDEDNNISSYFLQDEKIPMFDSSIVNIKIGKDLVKKLVRKFCEIFGIEPKLFPSCFVFYGGFVLSIIKGDDNYDDIDISCKSLTYILNFLSSLDKYYRIEVKTNVWNVSVEGVDKILQFTFKSIFPNLWSFFDGIDMDFTGIIFDPSKSRFICTVDIFESVMSGKCIIDKNKIKNMFKFTCYDDADKKLDIHTVYSRIEYRVNKYIEKGYTITFQIDDEEVTFSKEHVNSFALSTNMLVNIFIIVKTDL